MVEVKKTRSRKTRIKAAAAGALATVLCAGAVMAALTSTDTATNRFELAENLDVHVVEEYWEAQPDTDADGVPDHAEGIIPTQHVAKDPAIENASNVPAYLFAEVSVPVRNVVVANADNTKNPAADTELFAWTVNPGWTLKETIEGEGETTYRYAYDDVVAAGKTATLFDEVVYANVADATLSTDEAIQNLVVNGHAIQAAGFADKDAAYIQYFGDYTPSDPKDPEEEKPALPTSVTLTFDSLGGTEVAPIEGVPGAGIEGASMPTNLKRDGYIFKGWWTKDGSATDDWGTQVKALPSTFPEQNITYYAKWQARTLYIDFTDDGRSSYDDLTRTCYAGQDLRTDGELTPLPIPEKAGYTFAGWYFDEERAGEVQEFYPETMPTDHILYYAKWVKNVIYAFDMGGSGIDQIAPVEVAEGELAEKPTGIVVENGYEAAFFANVERTEPFDWDAPAEEDTTIYVAKVAQPAKIVFNTNGGTEVAAIEGVTGEDIDVDAELPTTELLTTYAMRSATPNYEFDAWYTENGATEGDLEGADEDWGHPVTSYSYFKYTMPAGTTVLNARYTDINDTTKTPFAVLTEDGVLNFYKRDASEVPTEGDTYDGAVVSKVYVGEGVESSLGTAKEQPWRSDRNNVTSVSYKDTLKPKNLDSMFEDLIHVETIDLANLDVSACNSMSSTFKRCNWLTGLDLETWNVSNVANTSYMFQGCGSLEHVYLDQNITFQSPNINCMFDGCRCLTDIDPERWDVSKVTSMSSVLSGCFNLEELDLTSWNVSNVTNMRFLLDNCTKLKNVDTTGWDTGRVKTMLGAFNGCNALEEIKGIEDWDTTNVTEICFGDEGYSPYGLFGGCYKLGNMNLSGWDVSNITDMTEMFYNNKSIEELDLTAWDLSNVRNMKEMFRYCSALKTVKIKAAHKTWNINAKQMFEGCTALETWDPEQWTIKSATMNTNSMFRNCQSMVSINTGGWTTCKSSDATSMFENCYALKELDLSCMKTSTASSLEKMFSMCSSLNDLQIDATCPSTNTAQSTKSMLFSCSSLEQVDLSCLKRISDATSMFENCSSLKSIDVPNMDTSSCTNMSYMFRGCAALTALDAEEWNTQNVTNMNHLFNGCSSIVSLDLSGWNVAKVTTHNSFNYDAPGIIEPSWVS